MILCTASASLDLNAYLKLLKPRRAFVLVGLAPVETPLTVRALASDLLTASQILLQFRPFSIVDSEKRIEGSIIGSPSAMREMLEFSAKHKCFPQVKSDAARCGAIICFHACAGGGHSI